MKLVQLIEYNLRNIFLDKSYIKRNFWRTLFQNLAIDSISGSIVSKSFIQFVFIVSQTEGYQNILKLTVDYLLLPHIKPFKRIIKRDL